MSCRWTCTSPPRALSSVEVDTRDSGIVAIYVDLAKSRRLDDFYWFARSQGVPPEKIDKLWHGILGRLALVAVGEAKKLPSQD